MKLHQFTKILLSVLLASGSAVCPSTIYNFETKDDPHKVLVIKHKCVHIVRLTQNSLKRFTNLQYNFIMKDFTIDDIETLNQSNLFTHHTTLRRIQFIKYNGPGGLAVHEDLFSGMVNLQLVALSGLKLETLPKKLFHNLIKLKLINLSNNKLKTLHPDTFSKNPKLFRLELGGNKLLESGIALDLTLLNEATYISLDKSNVKDFNTLMPIFGHPNVTHLTLVDSNLTNIKISYFAHFPARQNVIRIWIKNWKMDFFITDLQQNGIVYETIPYRELDATIENSTANIGNFLAESSDLCNDCRFIKEIFKIYLQGTNVFSVRLTNSQVLYSLHFICDRLENHYTRKFKRNCPANCTCQYNPFLDRVWIDCNGKNLTRVPTIRFPSQFKQIESISLDLSNNFLITFVLINLDHRVVKVMSEINLNKNPLRTVNFGEAGITKNNSINYCQNSMTNQSSKPLVVHIKNVKHLITKDGCSIRQRHPFRPMEPLLYIRNKSRETLDLLLENEVCYTNLNI